MLSKEELTEDYYANFSALTDEERTKEYNRILANLQGEHIERHASYRKMVGPTTEDPQLEAMVLEPVQSKFEALRLARARLYEEKERPAQECGEKKIPLDSLHLVDAAAIKLGEVTRTQSQTAEAVMGASISTAGDMFNLLVWGGVFAIGVAAYFYVDPLAGTIPATAAAFAVSSFLGYLINRHYILGIVVLVLSLSSVAYASAIHRRNAQSAQEWAKEMMNGGVAQPLELTTRNEKWVKAEAEKFIKEHFIEHKGRFYSKNREGIGQRLCEYEGLAVGEVSIELGSRGEADRANGVLLRADAFLTTKLMRKMAYSGKSFGCYENGEKVTLTIVKYASQQPQITAQHSYRAYDYEKPGKKEVVEALNLPSASGCK